jgi:Zn-finger nucleic acid-binding protein
MSTQPPPFPSDQPPGQYQPPGTFVCPKCRGAMRTYDRNGVHIEQCDTCRGVFLDFGELEALSRMESQFIQQPPPAQYGPGWGHHGSHKYRKRGMSSLFFSS